VVVVIYTGERWESSQGRYLRHKGTASYLKNIGAKIVPNSAEVIDARDVDEQGRLRLPAEEPVVSCDPPGQARHHARGGADLSAVGRRSYSGGWSNRIGPRSAAA
jgi:hypothetical protein